MLFREWPGFSRKVADFLEREAREMEGARQPRPAEEIRQLTLESICLFWPDRPDDGMLYFDGPDEYRVWRCDYVDREPRALGFDS